MDGENSGQRIDLNPNRPARLLEQIFVPVGKEDNRFFRVIHNFIGETGLVFDDQLNTVSGGDIFRRDNRKFIPGNAALELNPANAPACGRAAQSRPVEHVWKTEVVNIAGDSSDLLAS